MKTSILDGGPRPRIRRGIATVGPFVTHVIGMLQELPAGYWLATPPDPRTVTIAALTDT